MADTPTEEAREVVGGGLDIPPHGAAGTSSSAPSDGADRYSPLSTKPATNTTANGDSHEEYEPDFHDDDVEQREHGNGPPPLPRPSATAATPGNPPGTPAHGDGGTSGREGEHIEADPGVQQQQRQQQVNVGSVDKMVLTAASDTQTHVPDAAPTNESAPSTTTTTVPSTARSGQSLSLEIQERESHDLRHSATNNSTNERERGRKGQGTNDPPPTPSSLTTSDSVSTAAAETTRAHSPVLLVSQRTADVQSKLETLRSTFDTLTVQGRYEDAVECHAAFLTAQEEYYLLPSLEVAQSALTLNTLALARIGLRDLAGAKSLLVKAMLLTGRGNICDERCRLELRAMTLNNISVYLTHKGNLNLALTHLTRALGIEVKLTARARGGGGGGEQNVGNPVQTYDVVSTHVNMTVLLMKLGRNRDALVHAKLAYRLCKAAFAQEHQHRCSQEEREEEATAADSAPQHALNATLRAETPQPRKQHAAHMNESEDVPLPSESREDGDGGGGGGDDGDDDDCFDDSGTNMLHQVSLANSTLAQPGSRRGLYSHEDVGEDSDSRASASRGSACLAVRVGVDYKPFVEIVIPGRSHAHSDTSHPSTPAPGVLTATSFHPCGGALRPARAGGGFGAGSGTSGPDLRTIICYNLAVLHEKLKEYTEAVRAYNNALKYEPSAELRQRITDALNTVTSLQAIDAQRRSCRMKVSRAGGTVGEASPLFVAEVGDPGTSTSGERRTKEREGGTSRASAGGGAPWSGSKRPGRRFRPTQ